MKIQNFILLIFSAVNFISCTGNDLFDDEVTLDKKTVTGKITLSDKTDHSGVYVWLESFNNATTTDSDGNFSIKLSSSVTPNGLGNYKIYFYLSEYSLDSCTVTILDGKFIYDKSDLDLNGKISKDIKLSRIMHFSIGKSADSDSILVLTFQSSDSKSEALIPLSSPSVLSTCFILNKDREIVKTISNTGFYWVKIAFPSRTDTFYFDLTSVFNLPHGSYFIKPFFYANIENLPIQMIKSIQKNFKQPDSDYLNIPFKTPLFEIII